MTQAFATIREAACFDSHSNVPHPENLKFQASEERRALYKLGTKLVEIVSNPDGEDLQYAAHTVRRHFWNDLGLSQPPDLATDLPRFLQSPSYKIEPRTNPQELASQLASVSIPERPVPCIVSSKLALLQKLLNLSDTVIKFLALAYANCSIHSLTRDETSDLKTALAHIGVADNIHRNCAVAILLDAPLAAVEAMFEAPSALVALRFVEASAFNQRCTLQDAFTLTTEFVTLLETLFRSHEALVAAILEPEQDFDLLDDGVTPIGHLYGILPKDIAEAYECAVLDRPLKSLHIHALVSWYTAGHRMLPSAYSPLAGRVTVEVVREAVKRAALDCCIANVPINSFSLMRALYVAATPTNR